MMTQMEAPLLVSVGKDQFYLPPRVIKIRREHVVFDEFHQQKASKQAPYLPIVLVQPNLSPTQTSFELEDVDQLFGADDDLNNQFFQTILVAAPLDRHQHLELGSRTLTNLKKWKTNKLVFVDVQESVSQGPYFLSPQGLRQSWKCYADPLGAFVTSVIPMDAFNTAFRALGAPVIPVPSRHYFSQPSPERPLSGRRFAVKDVMDVAGVQTSNCSRAYSELYPISTNTAPCVQKLIDAGAVLVGKTKTVQFASGAHPTDWVDSHCSFNPRGDGYQSPSMSSVGSACAMAGYDWLDFALGSDTFGSVIMPAAATGLFALRPTFGIQDRQGVIPVSQHLDTIGFFARDIEVSVTVAKALLGDDVSCEPGSEPPELLYPEDLFPFQNPVYQNMVTDFVTSLEKHTKAKLIRTRLSQSWEDHGHGGHGPLGEYLHSTVAHIQLRDCYKNGQSFRQNYRDKFSKEAYVDPVIQYKWLLGEALSDEDYDQALKKKEHFQTWMSKLISPESKTMLVLPAGIDSPTYRDKFFGSVEESGHQMQGFGFDSLIIPALVGMPTFVVPIGQFSYTSEITQRQELLPVCVTITCGKGTDCTTLQILESFLKHTRGMHTSVKTGSTAF